MSDNILTLTELPFRAARLVREMARNVDPDDIRPLRQAYPVGFMDRERIAGLMVWQSRETFVNLFSNDPNFNADQFRQACTPGASDLPDPFGWESKKPHLELTSDSEPPPTLDSNRDGSPSSSPTSNEVSVESSLPIDYEPCGTCGFDHQYDNINPRVAAAIHDAHTDQDWSPCELGAKRVLLHE